MFSSYLEFQTMGKVQNPSNSACSTPSSEPIRLYITYWSCSQSEYKLLLCVDSKEMLNICKGRMPSAGMLRRLALVKTDGSEERSVSIIKVTRIRELGTLPVTSNRRTLMMEALGSFETSILTRTTRRNIPEDGILHSHHHGTSNIT
jgi:hypothetical protein